MNAPITFATARARDTSATGFRRLVAPAVLLVPAVAEADVSAEPSGQATDALIAAPYSSMNAVGLIVGTVGMLSTAVAGLKMRNIDSPFLAGLLTGIAGFSAGIHAFLSRRSPLEVTSTAIFGLVMCSISVALNLRAVRRGNS